MKLYARDVSIIGKINSFKDDVQNKIVGDIHNAASKMRRGLKNLMDAGFNRLEKGNTRLAIETSVLPENIDEIYDIWNYCRSHTIFPLVDTVLYEGSAKQHSYDDFLVPYTRLVEEVGRIRLYERIGASNGRLKSSSVKMIAGSSSVNWLEIAIASARI
ncbi:hypothetical protein ACLECU_04160 [Lonsdalea quercina]|uniref:hypothetical protein n=1 Tax=Lonsdalea quercina TaxID=71657 RepID=UPI003975D51C